MSETPEESIGRELAELEAILAGPLPDAARRRLERQLARLRQQAGSVVDLGGAQAGAVSIGDVAGRDVRKGPEGEIALSDDARIDGVAVGVNLGTVVYGRDPSEDERRQLSWYLARLAARMGRLSLRGLATHLDEGRSALTLERVYVTLAEDGATSEVAAGSFGELRAYFAGGGPGGPLAAAYDPDLALPHRAIVFVGQPETVHGGPGHRPHGRGAAPAELSLQRATLITEMVGRHALPRVLLGDPGSGKSTFLRHLAWAVARRGLDQPLDDLCLFGWPPELRLLPVLVSLRALAGRLARDGVSDATVQAALRDAVAAEGVPLADTLLSAALYRGAALLLLDGLDEVPAEAIPGRSVDRRTAVRAVREFVEGCPPQRVVVTCRTRAFDASLRALIGWAAPTIAPLTLGQVRHFVPAWYGELAARGVLTAEQAGRLAEKLIAAVAGSQRLRQMAGSPLLLTMMALVLLDAGELPKDRPQLYERVLRLLLGQWDQVREGQGLGDALGLPDWGSERIQPLLDRLAYLAHLGASSEDGRGRLSRAVLYQELIDFFRTARVPGPGDTALRCLEYIDQRSGLLAPDGAESYVVAHLTLQEHCAGRHIALNADDPVALALRHRAEDRWREPILLAAGLMRPAELQGLLADLVDAEGKPPERRYRDLILAAEIGSDRDWDYLRTRPAVKVDRLQRELRSGLVALLADRGQPLPIAERVRAALLLGDLGDPRYPVTLEEWRQAVDRAAGGDAGGYFCPLPPGEGRPAGWIARYAVTNQQLQAWLRATGAPPWPLAQDAHYGRPNQPAAGVSWLLATAFCAWLSQQLCATVRLPSEAEWVAAAYGGDGRLYPWGSDRPGERAASKADLEQRGWPYTAPVGCYPAGASAVGALDMAGNVWEWTDDLWQADPASAPQEQRVLRGGGYRSTKSDLRPTARIKLQPNLGFKHGFRVVLELGDGPPGR